MASSNRIRGGRPRPLSNLQLRRKAFDRIKTDDRKGMKRPGSTNAHKQA